MFRHTRLASGDAGSTRACMTDPSTRLARRRPSGSNATSGGSRPPPNRSRQILFSSYLWRAEVAASDLAGFVEFQQRQNGRGDVAEAAAFAECGAVPFFGDVDEGDRVGGVGGVGAAGDRVDEHLGVAVV